MKFQAIKGVRDILPPESALWNLASSTLHARCSARSASPKIRSPIFERTDLFAHAVGQETDALFPRKCTPSRTMKTPELVELRAAAVTFVGSFGTQEVFVHFTSLVGNFVLAAENAFKAGHIPKTPENERTLQNSRPYHHP